MTTQKTQAGQKSGSQFAQNPFLAFDVNQVMAAFDPAKFAGEFAKLTDRYQVPGFDMEAIVSVHQMVSNAIVLDRVGDGSSGRDDDGDSRPLSVPA